MNKFQILIVDDDRLLSHCLKNYLVENGHICSCLLDSSKVVGWLDRNPCDAVITDIRMPEIDGIALTAMIREKHPTLPILILTGLGYEESLLQAALDAGANSYVSKAMGPKALLMAFLQTIGQQSKIPHVSA